MNRHIWAGAHARGHGWAVLGLLITIAFLAHDLGMVVGATGGEPRFVPSAVTSPTIHVVHIGGDMAAHQDRDPHWEHAVPVEPPQSHCEMARAAVPTANDALDTTLQAIAGAIEPVVGWHGVGRSPWAAGVTFRSSRDQRTLFQVFLI